MYHITQPHEMQCMHNVLKDMATARDIIRDTVSDNVSPTVKYSSAEEELDIVRVNIAESVNRLEFFAQFEVSNMQETQSLAIIIADLRQILCKIK